ncbi:uncharacterized protein LOC142503293 [Ascaphus truei]|uniref:uncharacterized protein LOC142503293 n=1 Tax=Ascaphus truei TaxID=8439 RepID=UPI003F59F993
MVPELRDLVEEDIASYFKANMGSMSSPFTLNKMLHNGKTSKKIEDFLKEVELCSISSMDNSKVGFIPGRQDSDNTRRIIDLIAFASKNKIPSMVLSLDAEKAFDRIDWVYLERTLHAFGFNGHFLQAVTVLYAAPIMRHVFVSWAPLVSGVFVWSPRGSGAPWVIPAGVSGPWVVPTGVQGPSVVPQVTGYQEYHVILGRGHKESQSEASSPAKEGTGSESEELHFCLAFKEQGAETLNCSTPEQTMSELSTTIFQLPGGFLVVEIDGREYLRCLCIHCRTPGPVPSTKARCPQCGTYYLWPTEPRTPIKTPRGASPGTLTEVAETADEAALVPCFTTEVGTKAQPTTEPRETPAEKSATTVEVPERAHFIPLPTGGAAKDPGDSRAEEPSKSSSEEEDGVPSVAMRLPANHPSCKKDGGLLTREREQTSPDTPRRRALVRPEARRSPTAVVTPSVAETGSETAPEEPESISRQRSEGGPEGPRVLRRQGLQAMWSTK